MSRPKRVLLVDDDKELLRTLAQSLHGHGWECKTASSAREAIDYLETGATVDAVVTDLRMPGADGLQLTRQIRQRWNHVAVIILTAYGSITSAVEGIKLGAANYVIKPFPPEELLREIEKACDRDEPTGTRTGRSGDDRFVELVGSHPSMIELKKNIKKFAQLPANVLILGESGTGKELVARAIHRCSPRGEEPFVAVNCGAFSRSLLEDQLFGHARGAFTGATSDKDGLFVAAGKGTVFLDEIAEMDLDLQVKLLRTLQEREVTPLGSNRPVRWHARLVCATNRDLDRLVAERQFREDLYYRINVLVLRVPPLRERRDDVPRLVDHFLEEFGAQTGRRKTISEEASRTLLNANWPGNVRELRNTLERAWALGTSGMIQPPDLPAEMHPDPGSEAGGFPTLEDVERDHIIRALRTAGGTRVIAARLLGIDRNRLTRMIKRLKIDQEFPALGPRRKTREKTVSAERAGRLPGSGAGLQS